MSTTSALLALFVLLGAACSSFSRSESSPDAGDAAVEAGSAPQGAGVPCGESSCAAPSFCCAVPAPRDIYAADYTCRASGCTGTDDIKISCGGDRDCPSGSRCCARIAAFSLTGVACAPTCDGAQDQHVCPEGDSSSCGAGKSCIPAETLLNGKLIPSVRLAGCER